MLQVVYTPLGYYFFSASYMLSTTCSNNDVVYYVCYFQQANNQIKESGGRFGKMIIMFVARIK